MLLYYAGGMRDRALRRHRLTESDVHNAVRRSSQGSLAGAQAVVLHQGGSMGVVSESSMSDGSSLLPYVERHRD